MGKGECRRRGWERDECDGLEGGVLYAWNPQARSVALARGARKLVAGLDRI